MSDENPQYPNLASALAAFQSDLPSVKKGNTAKVESAKGKYTYDYADLADVSETVLPLLGKVGLAWVTMPRTEDDGTINLDWSLIHGTSGDGIHGSVPVGRKGDRWQDLGSAITYARRYCLVAVTGVAPGGDDNDGEGASAGAQPKPEPVKEYLPAGLYDLASVTSRKDAEQMFYRARGAGHLNLIVGMPDGTEMAFGDWLRATGSGLPEVAPEDEPAAEAQAPTEEDAEAAAIAAHEAELARDDTAEESNA